MKREILCVDDYGTGGTWFVVSADAESSIKERYPFLTVVSSRPKWMTDEILSNTRRNFFIDLDDPPTEGMVALILRERRLQHEGSPSGLAPDELSRIVNERLKKT
jgi:hypothetical protein